MDNYRGETRMFGFFNKKACSGLAGCSGLHVRESCSDCSVDFVEKMWENLWGKRWENCGNYCAKVRRRGIWRQNGGIKSFYTARVEKFCGWICTWFYLYKSKGFTQFPHSLLLRLLII